jgi:sigma-54 dependent transcriptional regulator, acetoin dehydrogenase operon transcriptional activator AcoR
MLQMLSPHTTDNRLALINQARQTFLAHGGAGSCAQPLGVEAWVDRSWRRCLANGQRPGDRLAFDALPQEAARRAEEASHALVQAAKPVLERLCRAIANTHYFAILTDAHGVVVDVGGPIDRSDRRARLITRIGVDLSERAVGTTAIGSALAELQPVWMHRGEHFFNDTGAYSCAGAPLMGPDGSCVGMLDLTGIDTMERPELRHLVTQSARSIENALTLACPHRLVLRMNWSARALGDEADGLISLDTDGWVTGANTAARQMVPSLGLASVAPRAKVHTSELFALPWEQLFDASLHDATTELPLWSGLRLAALPQTAGNAQRPYRVGTPPPLKDVEALLIQKAIVAAQGNVSVAAKQLGISRATVYRRLHEKKH